MGFGNSGPSIELQGVNYGRRGKAFYFQADYWEEAEYLPASQCEWLPDRDSDEEGRGTMIIPGWLAKKNGWSEA